MKKMLLISVLIVAASLFGFYTVSGVSAQSMQTIQVSEKEFSLTPNTFTVQMGQPVQITVTNNGAIQHNLALMPPSGGVPKQLFATNLNPGESRTVQFTFTEAGDWTMFCPIPGHEQQGMKGVIHVMAGSSGATMTSTPAAQMTPAANAPAASTTPAAGTPSNLPTSGGSFSASSLLIVGALGILLIGAGFALRSWSPK